METANTFRLALAQRPVLTTARLAMRRPVEADIPAIVEHANDWEVARRLGRLPYPYGITDARFFLDQVVPNELAWAITFRAEGVLIGVVGLVPEPENRAAELGYWLERRFWGQGIATEAASAAVEYAFQSLGLTMLTSGYFTDNPASGRVLTKLGFVEAGRGERPCLAARRKLPLVLMALADRPERGI